MKAERYSTPEVFETLRAEWDSLLQPERPADFFISRDWQRIWWKHLGRGELSVIVVRDAMGAVQGIGSWFVEEQNGERVVRTVGCQDVSDYLDIVCCPGYEEQVCSALLDMMLSPETPAWDAFHLCNIPEGSFSLEMLPRLAQARGLKVEIEEEDICPVLALPDSYEAYLEQLDKKQRHELRRKRRRAEDYGVNFTIVGDEHDLDEEIDAFFELMAMSTSAKAEFLQEEGHRAFFHEIGHTMLDNGALNLLFLTIEGKRAAAMWQFAYGKRMMLYNSGLNPGAFSALSPGIVLLTYSVEDAIKRGFEVYDFLQGDEEYKTRMGAEPTKVYNLLMRRA